MTEIGDHIKIIATDNKNYTPYLSEVWTVCGVSHNSNDHPKYDNAIGGELIDCINLPFCLYSFEFKIV